MPMLHCIIRSRPSSGRPTALETIVTGKWVASSVAVEYQTATSDVLKVISRSTFDLQSVLDTLVETAARLCNADMSLMFRREGDRYRGVAFFGLPPEWQEFIENTRRQNPDYAAPRPGRGSIVSRIAQEGGIVHVHDVAADPEYERAEAVRLGGVRTVAGVPLLREGELVGAFTLGRQRVEPFSERQIELVRTFADQAVIAIENTRLLTELRESLEQQQAMAEVLQVINASPGNLLPVFEAILDKAHSLCGVTCGSLQLYHGERFRAIVAHGMPETMAARLREGYVPVPAIPNYRLLSGERSVHIPDMAQIDHPLARAVLEAGMRTLLCVALRKDEALLGQIVAAWPEVRASLEKETALLQNFAAQAVIAMDNARLLNEIRQRQAELPGVIPEIDIWRVAYLMLKRYAMRRISKARYGRKSSLRPGTRPAWRSGAGLLMQSGS
jgi:GAF domain-containing protein